MYRLVLRSDAGVEIATHALTSRPLYVGRAATNDLVLADPSVSSRHTAVWATGSRVFVEDLGSRNGTFAGTRRVRSPIALRDGETIGVGPTVRLAVEPDAEASATGDRLLVEDVESGVRVQVQSDRVALGTFHVLLDPDGQAWIGREDDTLDPVDVDEEFEVGGRRFCLRRAPLEASATWDVGEARYPIRVVAELSGPTGPRATLTDVVTGACVALEAENRAVLVYVLARHLESERSEGVPERDAGWFADHEVSSQVWGRLSTARNLNVLITRVRNDLRRGGIDPWCLEKRRGFVRLRVEEVEVRT